MELSAGNRANARIFLNVPDRHLQNKIAPIKSGEVAVLESFLAAMNLRQPE